MTSILVTGAAGTIGSEVCRQLVASGKYQAIYLVDHAETPLFWLKRELDAMAEGQPIGIVPIIINVANRDGMVRVLQQTKPFAVIHCAALKHVGMCEQNIIEAIATNVWGTWVVAEQAALVGARVIVVSTDKAVMPTTVMGATKRLAEMISAGLYANVVRLVNIEGSNGAVHEVFQRQIEAGGPITVTSKDMVRMFTTAYEAAGLIIGQIDREGGPRVQLPTNATISHVNIMDLARALARASGKTIDIVVTGASEIEKKTERLTSDYERATMQEGDTWFVPRQPSWVLGTYIQQLMQCCAAGDEKQARQLLFAMAGDGA